MSDLYQLTATADGKYVIRKFDDDFEKKSEWSMWVGAKGGIHCDCWHGQKSWCRHKRMFKSFQVEKHISDGWFLDYTNGVWREPCCT